MQIDGGTRLGQYEIVERLGAGEMGEVWLAEDTRLRRKVAIKVLPPELGADPDRLARLEREARLLAQLSHPNIATVYGFGSEDGVHYVADGGRQRSISGELEIITPAGDRTPLDLPATNGYSGPGVIDAEHVMLTRLPDDSGGFTAGILDLTRSTFT